MGTLSLAARVTTRTAVTLGGGSLCSDTDLQSLVGKALAPGLPKPRPWLTLLLPIADLQGDGISELELPESHDAEEGKLGTVVQNGNESLEGTGRMTPSPHANSVESFQSKVDLGLETVNIFLQ